MREEIENIATEPIQLIPTKLNENFNNIKPQITDQNSQMPVTFEDDLKRQLLDLKQKNRHLQVQIDDFVSNQKLPDYI